MDDATVSGFLQRPHEDQTLIVLVDEDAPGSFATDLATTYRLEIDREDEIALLNGCLVRFRVPSDLSLADVLSNMSRDIRIAALQPDFLYSVQDDPGPSGKPNGQLPQYAPARMGLDMLGAQFSGQDVTIAIVDTGIDHRHRELHHAIALQFDATGLAEDGIKEADPHGTAIAGVIASNFALSGIAPAADLLDVRVFHRASPDAPVRGTSHWIIKGLDWSAAQQADIYNLSFAGPEDPLLQRAIETLAGDGAVLIGAAGNNGPDAPPAYPAAYPEVVAVTATDEADLRYDQANRGGHIALSAPGVDVITAAPDDTYRLVSGTSIAAAHVSGIAALMLERRAGIDADALYSSLTGSARDLGEPGDDPDFGAGLVAAPAALGLSPN